MKDRSKKKNLVSPFQISILAGIAGAVANHITEAVDYNRQLALERGDGTLDPGMTVSARKKKALPAEALDVETVTEQIVSESYPYLTLVDDKSTRYYLTQNVNIGRYPHNDICLSDETVSRVHCRIVNKDGDFYLVDMYAANPTKLNGKLVDNARSSAISELYRFKLRDGDIITIGRAELRFCDGVKRRGIGSRSVRDYSKTVVL